MSRLAATRSGVCRFLRSKQPTSFPGSFNNPIGEKGAIEWNYVWPRLLHQSSHVDLLSLRR